MLAIFPSHKMEKGEIEIMVHKDVFTVTKYKAFHERKCIHSGNCCYSKSGVCVRVCKRVQKNTPKQKVKLLQRAR